MGIQSEGIANALPRYGVQDRIAHLRVWFTIRVLWWKVNITLLNRNYTSPANTLPYETLPGGTTNLNDQQDLTTNHGNGFLGLWRLASNTTLYNGDICFVPTYSALDVATVTTATAYAKYVNNVTDNPSPPRVASYIAQENVNGTQFNQAHIRFTARNSEWIFNQMERNTAKADALACSADCQFLTISSSLSQWQRLCPGIPVTFSASGLPAGAVVTWSATPANLFTSSSGVGATFTTSSTGVGGTGTVTATLAGPCGVNATQTILMGPGEPIGTYYSSTSGPNQPLITVNNVTPGEVRITMNGPYNFTFTSDQPNTVPVFGGVGLLAGFNLKAGQGVRITATSPAVPGGSCGLVGNYVFIASSGYRLVATPNPASSELVVTAVDEDQPETSPTPSPTAPPFEAELYDNFGKKVKAGKSDKGKAKFDVRELPAGLYNVRAGKGKEAISKHIEITH